MRMLEVRDLDVAYGAAPALWGTSLRLAAGELVCVLGPNGAGKTTLINAIAGLHPARGGRIVMEGRDLTTLPPHRFCSAGIAIVPEGRRRAGRAKRAGAHAGACLRAVPGGSGQARRTRRRAVRRAAADGRDRPRADGAAASPAAR
jgi:energy-coupling factor transporter ATP-binding protein EcfA2